MGAQLNFFKLGEDSDELSDLRNEFQEVKASGEKVRKSLFARHGELARKYSELHERMQIIERNICHEAVTPN